MSLSQKFVALSNRMTSRFRSHLYGQYSILPFEEKHLKNLVSLPDRIEMLKRLPLGAVAAEIGVNKGDFSEHILKHTQPKKLVLIDIWATRRYHDGLYEVVRNKFKKEVSAGQVEIIRDLSFGGIATCPDQYFDWVYLDTDHTYNTTKRELELLRPKMKSGGIIAGHDYIIGNWNAGYRYGVIEAVREFCINHDWEMIFLSHELDIPPSFSIREIQ